jgi:hypothetical protein
MRDIKFALYCYDSNIMYGFDDMAADTLINGYHGGINFNSGAWQKKNNFAGMANCAVFSGDVAGENFTLPEGTVMKSFKIGDTSSSAVHYLVFDNKGNSTEGYTIPGQVKTINTGWTNTDPNATIMAVFFDNRQNTAIGDIEYGAPTP